MDWLITSGGPKLKRLVAAINADVFCFQEEWDQEKFNEGAAATLPAGTYLLWNGSCAIATQLQLSRLEMVLDRAVAGLVTTWDGCNVVVISAHFKCCGFAGSNEDDLRIQQASVQKTLKMRPRLRYMSSCRTPNYT